MSDINSATQDTERYQLFRVKIKLFPQARGKFRGLGEILRPDSDSAGQT